MFNLSIQEVVLSIEKTPVIKEKHFVYQHYHNFFGNLQELELDIGNLNFDIHQGTLSQPTFTSCPLSDILNLTKGQGLICVETRYD